jgi:hypothetical protein
LALVVVYRIKRVGHDFETSCIVGAPLLMKMDRLERATFWREDDLFYTENLIEPA